MVNPDRARFPEAILFCADCDKEFGQARNGSLGYYFVCPQEKDPAHPHLARVILNQRAAKWWLARERQLLTFQVKFSPFAVLRRMFSTIQAGWYVIISTAFLCVAIALWNSLATTDSLPSRGLAGVFFLLVLWRFVDIFVTNVSITFTSRFPANPVRSVIFSFAAYVQVALCYAFWYLVLGGRQGQFGEETNPVAAVFYSFATIATVGFGDLKPQTASAKLLVASELILGLFFVAIVIAQVAGWAATSRREAGEFPVDDLKPPQAAS